MSIGDHPIMDLFQIILALIGSFIAGIINTLAGNGSAITLPFMTEMLGMPGNVANGTNRLGLLSQTMMGSWVFYKNGKLDIAQAKPYIFMTFAGAIPGVWLAVSVSNEQFRSVFGFLLTMMLVVILVKPERWLKEVEIVKKPKYAIAIPLFFILGFYGGFIQMGMGIFFLAIMVLTAGFDLIRANAIKVLVVALFTIMVILVFEWRGLIDWRVGMVLALGQAAGGYLAATYASHFPNAKIWAYRLLIVVVLGSILSIFFS